MESDEELELSPVQPIPKKQRKELTSAKKKEPEIEAGEDETDYAVMEKYMGIPSWEDLIERIETIERGDGGKLFIYGFL